MTILSHLRINDDVCFTTLRLVIHSFIQDNLKHFSKPDLFDSTLMSKNNKNQIPGLIVPVNKNLINKYYKKFNKFMEVPLQAMSNTTLDDINFDIPEIFFYLSIFMVNQIIEINFKIVNKIDKTERLNKLKKLKDSVAAFYSQTQMIFLDQILNSFTGSNYLRIDQQRETSVDMRLYIIGVMALFYSVESQENIFTQTLKALKIGSNKIVFLNFSNGLNIGLAGSKTTEITSLNKCRNCGYIFGINNCGMPMAVFPCPTRGCGQQIGGTSHKWNANTVKLTPEEAKKYTSSTEDYNIHNFLYSNFFTFDKLNNLCFRFLHSMIHAFYLGVIETQLIPQETLFNNLTPNYAKDMGHRNFADKRDYLIGHIKADFEVIQELRSKNYLEFSLFSTINTELHEIFVQTKDQQRTVVAYNQFAHIVGGKFKLLLDGSNGKQFNFEKDVKDFIAEIDQQANDFEDRVRFRDIEINKGENRLNMFLINHLRNTTKPSAENLIMYMDKNPDLKANHGICNFFNYNKVSVYWKVL